MNEPEIGGFDGFLLPDPVNTWRKSFYDNYMAYIKTAERDAVRAAQIASPGSQVTIALIAAVLEEAKHNAHDLGTTLQEYLTYLNWH